MTILIEIEPFEMRESNAFSRNAELTLVSVSSASFSATRPLPQEIGKPLFTGIKFAPKEIALFDASVRASTSFQFVISKSPNHEENEIIVLFDCVLDATYQLQKGYKPSESELQAFQKANVVYNCWPFFREFIQNSASRMGIPAPPVPFVRVLVTAKQESRPLIESSPKSTPMRKKSTPPEFG
jgi:hypothetical protein